MPDEEFLGFVDRRTGQPVRVVGAGRDAGGIGGNGYDLTASGGSTYRADDADDLAVVLAGRTPSYNQTPERPGLGSYDAGDLVPARVRISTSFDVVDLASEATPFVRRVSERRVPPAVAFQYVPGLRDVLDRSETFTMLIATVGNKDPVSLVGRPVGHGSEDYPTKLTVLAAVPVPEDFADLVADGPGVLLVCRNDDRPSKARTQDLVVASATAWEDLAVSSAPGRMGP